MVIIELGDLKLRAEIFNDPVSKKFLLNLPYEIKITRWGEELYGPIQADLGEHNPVPDIPPGGIAYSRKGGFVCIFFGQTPAWPVDHIGNILDGEWKLLSRAVIPETIVINKA